MTHREACYELRRSARLYGDGKIDRFQWHASVLRILSARGPATTKRPEAAVR